MNSATSQDWTGGPAKLAAAVVLGGASIFGLMWSITTRAPAANSAGTPLGVVSNPAASLPQGQTPAPSAPSPVTLDHIVNLNTACAAELELLPGIGPAMAKRIIEYRESRGAFRSVNELDRVEGIGARMIERLRERVTVE